MPVEKKQTTQIEQQYIHVQIQKKSNRPLIIYSYKLAYACRPKKMENWSKSF